MRIGIGNDHAAIELKNAIVNHLIDKGYEVVNFGINDFVLEESLKNISVETSKRKKD